MKRRHSMMETYWKPKSTENSDAAAAFTVVENDPQPKPMVDRKPAPKRPNAADSFWNNHQAEYDERETPPERCSRVERHNDACPKLKDELETRRAISKPTAEAQLELGYDPNCRNCVRIQAERTRQLKANARKQDRRPRSRRRAGSRVTKTNKQTGRRKETHRKVTKALSRLFEETSVGTQITRRRETKKSDDRHKRHKKTLTINDRKSKDSDKVRLDERKKKTSSSNKDGVKSDNPDERYPRPDSKNRAGGESPDPYERYPLSSHEPSVSSYNSFYSMDHEPMCDNH